MMVTIAHSLGEASAENKGHGPETSRDAEGQDRYSRHKALLPVAEGNTSTSRGVKTRQGRGRLSDWLASRARRQRMCTACALSQNGRGHVVFPRRSVPGRAAACPREEDVWTLVRVPVPNVVLRPGRRAAAAGSLPEFPCAPSWALLLDRRPVRRHRYTKQGRRSWSRPFSRRHPPWRALSHSHATPSIPSSSGRRGGYVNLAAGVSHRWSACCARSRFSACSAPV